MLPGRKLRFTTLTSFPLPCPSSALYGSRVFAIPKNKIYSIRSLFFWWSLSSLFVCLFVCLFSHLFVHAHIHNNIVVVTHNMTSFITIDVAVIVITMVLIMSCLLFPHSLVAPKLYGAKTVLLQSTKRAILESLKQSQGSNFKRFSEIFFLPEFA